jgi:hypothetical protein
MNRGEQEKLRFRRQYILSPQEVDCPFTNIHLDTGSGYHLYSHPDLKVTRKTSGEKQIILLGDLFDYRFPEKDNEGILGDLIPYDFPELIRQTASCTGRYVILCFLPGGLRVFHDATAARKVYYCRKEKDLWLASQPHLLARVLGLGTTGDPSKLKYYGSSDHERLDYASIGSTTCYDEVRQLMPNHYLDATAGKVERFWPDKRLSIRPVEEVAEELSFIIRGYMEAITRRYSVMLPVTAGFDTRLLLAATRNFSGKIFYYINLNPGLSLKSTDIRIPRKLLKKLGLEYHILHLPGKVPEDFREVYRENNPFANPRYLPHIYNYYSHFQDRVNLPGNIASAPWGFNRLIETKVSGQTLAYIYRLTAYEHAIQYYTHWLEGCREACRDHNMPIVRLFYWEERIANWGTQIQMDKDIAQDDINPYNSRLLLEKFFSVEACMNNMPDYILHRRIIRRLWPETLSVPMNPSLWRSTLRMAKTLGLLDLLFLIRFKTAR